MPRVIPRPSTAQIENIHDAFERYDIIGPNRTGLRMVLLWSRGKTARQVAADPTMKCSASRVLAAIHRYRSKGLDDFIHPKPAGKRGQIPLPREKVQAIEEALRQRVKTGASSYRAIASAHGVSLGSVAGAAKRLGLWGTRH